MKILKRILRDREHRKELISKFQEEVWNGKGYSTDKGITEILSDLAYDLDFYESNEEWRREDPSYYGDERLEHEVKSAIIKLEEHKEASQ